MWDSINVIIPTWGWFMMVYGVNPTLVYQRNPPPLQVGNGWKTIRKLYEKHVEKKTPGFFFFLPG
jgi:hypothetical protein